MKYLLVVAVSILMFTIQAQAAETKQVCVEQVDPKTNKTKQVCKEVKVHKKLEGTKVPDKPAK